MERRDGAVRLRSQDRLAVLLQAVTNAAVLDPARQADGPSRRPRLDIGVLHREQRLLQPDTRPQDLARAEAVPRLQGIPPSDLPPVEPDPLREGVQHPLHGEVRLVCAEPPHRPGRGVVRVDRARFHVHVGNPVRAARVPRRPLQNLVAHARVCAGVPDDAGPDRDQAAFLVTAHGVGEVHRVAFGVEPHALRSGEGEQHGPAGRHRQQRGLPLDVQVLLRPERPAVRHLGDPDLLLRHGQQRSDLPAVVPYALALRIEVQGDPGLGVRDSEAGLRLQEGVFDELGVERLGDHVGRRGKGGIHIAALHLGHR